MKTAVVTLATGEYWKGAKVLFHTLRKYGQLPKDVSAIALGMASCDFAEAVPLREDYSWVPVCPVHFPRVADKFAAFHLDFDRIVMLDADMLCVGNCSYLWSDCIGRLPFYACRDTASALYYGDEIESIGLNPSRIFNAGTMIFNAPFPLPALEQIRAGELRAYDGGDQGYLNHYWQRLGVEIGVLPGEYNCCLDPYIAQVPEHAKRLIHFTGGNANPWNHTVPATDWRTPWLNRWKEEWDAC